MNCLHKRNDVLRTTIGSFSTSLTVEVESDINSAAFIWCTNYSKYSRGHEIELLCVQCRFLVYGVF